MIRRPILQGGHTGPTYDISEQIRQQKIRRIWKFSTITHQSQSSSWLHQRCNTADRAVAESSSWRGLFFLWCLFSAAYVFRHGFSFIFSRRCQISDMPRQRLHLPRRKPSPGTEGCVCETHEERSLTCTTSSHVDFSKKLEVLFGQSSLTVHRV